MFVLLLLKVSKKNGNLMSKLIYENETFLIRGTVFEVYKEMGCGFLESVYQENAWKKSF